MGYEHMIQKILQFIDDNIKDYLDADVLASIAGFSTYHFCRMFTWHVGHSVMGYIRLRRLAFAAVELSSERKVIDIAMDYGFETHSGFSKAFKRHYGTSPEKYRIHASIEKPPLPNLLHMNDKYQTGGIVMEPKFVTLETIKLVGYALKTRNISGENSKEIPEFWGEYLESGNAKRLYETGTVKNSNEYGACFPENPESGEFTYVIGMELKDGLEPPKDFHVCEIPPATYAVFSSPPGSGADFSKNIQGTWQYIMNEWFPASGYEYAANCVDFEFYDDERMMKKEFVCDIYLPVVKK